MTLVKLTHANRGVQVYVVKSQVCFWYTSPADKCTHVCVGPNVFPAAESPEEIERLLGAVAPAQQEEPRP